MIIDLINKKAVIIGGFGRIGINITMGLLEAGATVYVITRNKIKHKKTITTLKKKYKNFFCFQGNISSLIFLKKFIKLTKIKIDILFNCAVERSDLHPGGKIDSKKWQSIISKNSTALYVSTLFFSEIMKKNKIGGSVIIISSIYGIKIPDLNIYNGTKNFTPIDYPFLKAGSILLTKYFAKLYGKYNLRFNIIAPGGLDDSHMNPVLKKNYLKKTQIKRLLNSNDIKFLSLFLASDKSSYITGEVIKVDGGYCL